MVGLGLGLLVPAALIGLLLVHRGPAIARGPRTALTGMMAGGVGGSL